MAILAVGHCGHASYIAWLGCSPNRPKSVFWSELLGIRWYTANSFLSCTLSWKELMYKKPGWSGLIQDDLLNIADLYLIIALQSLKFKRPKVALNDRIDHFGTNIRNQETKLYQNNALVKKKFKVRSKTVNTRAWPENGHFRVLRWLGRHHSNQNHTSNETPF